MARSLHIVYFAWVKERLGKAEEGIDIPDEVGSISDLIEFMVAHDSLYEHVFSDLAKLRFALDQEFVPINEPIGDAQELAIFPPVTGG